MAAQKLGLPSGRLLSYIIRGSSAPDAIPLVYLHGTPSAYPAMKSLYQKCEEHNFKLVSFSRAGYGDSTRRPGRRVFNVVEDVKALLDHLGENRCFVIGWSGPHALACAARLEGCLGAVCVAGLAPYHAEDLIFLAGQGEENDNEFNVALRSEEELRKNVEAQCRELVESTPAGIVKEWSSILPEVDKKALLENSDLGYSLADTFHEALKYSSDGWVDDDLQAIQPWGFELDEIKVPVFLYQGSQDLMVPLSHGQWLSKHIASQILTSHLLQGEGHISIWIQHMDSMFKELVSLHL